jgi:hypothetical protein
MKIYSNLKAISKIKDTDPRTLKNQVWKKIVEIELENKIGKTKKVWYIHIDDIVLFVLQNK